MWQNTISRKEIVGDMKMVMQAKVRPRAELPTALVCTAMDGVLKRGL